MKNKISKNVLLFGLTLVSTVVFGIIVSQSKATNFETDIIAFGKQFKLLETKLDNGLRYQVNKLKGGSLDDEWISDNHQNKSLNIHIYRNDSLKYWNTNQLPIIRFSDIHFPADGILHLQNGWYFAKIKKVDDYLICASFLIRQDFSYENKDFVNDYANGLNVPFKSYIDIGEELKYQVKDLNGKYLFSIVPEENQTLATFYQILIPALLLFSISLWLLILSLWLNRKKGRYKFIAILLLLGIRYLSIYFQWFQLSEEIEMFNPTLYASSSLTPHFFDYLVNIIFLIFTLSLIRSSLKKMKRGKSGKFLALLMIVLSFLFWPLFVSIVNGLIMHSQIPMIVNKLFTLNIYSVISIASLGVLFYAFLLYLIEVLKYAIRQEVKATWMALICFFLGCFYFYYEINHGNENLLSGLFPLILFGGLLYVVYLYEAIQKIGLALTLLFLFSAVLSSMFGNLNNAKELVQREVYANQLATEKSIVTEVEYAGLSEKIKSDNFLNKFIQNPSEIGASDFQENLERRFFNGFWERYDMQFKFFDKNRNPLIDKQLIDTSAFLKLNNLIDRSCAQSEINPNIYFVTDYKDQYSYIIRQEIGDVEGEQGFLFCTLKSKKIPEEIGFPRLLISSKANVMESLEDYSIAKYQDDQLLTKYGDFNYPSSKSIMSKTNQGNRVFFDFDEYNHLLLNKTEHDSVVLSYRKETWLDAITSFSYLFSFFGLLLLPLSFRLDSKNNTRKTMSLALKIQVVMISLVFLSLLAFGWGSGVFVSNQYNQYTNEVIREKLNSVQTEVKAKLGDFDQLKIDDNGDYMQYILQKFARVFFTDINLYDTDGYLLATSRPKVFNVGLISEQMNSKAFSNLKFGKKSEFVQLEQIGNLSYSSAYQPFYNNSGEQLAYINLQHFGKQSEFENQIEKFLVAIINVFILLLAISIILAIFISNWLTSPLRILQESFANVRFGKVNERIKYSKNDEIGALVADYNRKLEELEFAADQLAQSERESAWREMAKQVAHEIKNPLTPMKLGIQQLLRTLDPNDPNSKAKVEKVANSMIEQIDALTKIANEFSNFAKMPLRSESEINLPELIERVVEVFSSEENVSLKLNIIDKQLIILADKDQLIRVFNNLIKNAIQSIPSERKGLIQINVTRNSDSVEIEIIDNGIGIDKEKRKNIFVPYFTTKSTGTGLGLAMVKQIIENHNGQIGFESKVNVGTTFRINLPLK